MLIYPFPNYPRPVGFSIHDVSASGAGGAPSKPLKVGTGQGLGLHSALLTAEHETDLQNIGFHVAI